jgi:hypothetical protein
MEKINVWYYKEGYRNNFGDFLGDYIPKKLTNKEIVYTQINTPVKKYVTVGSVLNQMIGINKNCIVWGSGIMTKNDTIPKEVELLAVRGPYTQQRLRDIGITPPDTVGDPALLLKKIYDPKIEKKYRLGIVPHYVDYEYVKKIVGDDTSIKVIDLITNDIEGTIDQFLSCEKIISSSLHGVIVSHTYNIPCLWVKFSEKLFGNSPQMGGNIKFKDYFSSVGIEPYDGFNFKDKKINKEEIIDLINNNSDKSLIIDFDFDKLYNSCPFKHNSNEVN